MRKFTIIMVALCATMLLHAQGTSFEGSDGFVLGPINLQNGWTTFSAIPDGPQISNVQATDGTFSLQIIDDAVAADGTLNGTFSPGFISSGDVTITLDIDAGPTGLSDVQIVTQSNSQMLLTARVNFNFQDQILVIDDVGMGLAFQDTGAVVPRGSSFEFTIEHRFSTSEILYYLNGSLIYTGGLVGGTNVEQYILFTDNFGSDAFFDNVQYADDNTLSVASNNIEDSVTIFPNPTNDNLNIRFTGNFGDAQVEIVNVSGQTVMRESINGFGQNTINTTDLATGIYLAKISSGNNSAIKKFIKN